MATIETAEELGTRIREARMGRGLSQEELGRRLDIRREAVSSLELGKRRVTTLELLGLARELEVPVGFFIERPDQDVISRRDAISEESTPGERESFSADVAVGTWLRAAETLRELGALRPPSNLMATDWPVKFKAFTDTASADWARLARQWAQIEGPVDHVQDATETFGLYLFVEDGAFVGASSSPDIDFGVAVVSSHLEPGRRRMTAAHELGHHLIGDAYSADVSGVRDDRERMIDAFALEFLLPLDDFRTRWAEQATESEDEKWEALLRIAAEYRVSWSAAVRRALDARLISKPDGAALRSRVPLRADFLAVLGREVPEDLIKGSYGAEWTKAVLRATVEHFITLTRAAQLLPGLLDADATAEGRTVVEPEP